MNEVRLSPVASAAVILPASSKGADNNAEHAVKAAGKTLPPSTADQQPVVADSNAASEASEKLQEAVVSINEYVQSIDRDLLFTVDEDTNRTVVKVIDSASGDLIRQIPEEVFLHLARKLNDDGEFKLIDAIG
ncbi:methionine synthase [Saccharophagus sp. K07]|uniref:flagellar protein FlaG n=1 Tax=Saccharophagus sp. K07 TaxID=2283636 RepID=UPI001651F4AC|nr:flagellar protein FlaG [Saccharophagus sp. K07]MBC6907413.1 methionine synthase [Saccharophagus sp. K07]